MTIDLKQATLDYLEKGSHANEGCIEQLLEQSTCFFDMPHSGIKSL